MKLIHFNLLLPWGAAGSHGLPKITQLVSGRARPPFWFPGLKNGGRSTILPSLQYMFTMENPQSISLSSLILVEVPKISDHGSCRFQLTEDHFRNALPREGTVTLPAAGWEGTQAGTVVYAEWQAPLLDNDSSFQMSLGLDQVEREGRMAGSLWSVLTMLRFW